MPIKYKTYLLRLFMKTLSCLILFTLIVLGCSESEKKIDYSVPEWSKKVVWYQIFPERFYNGDPDNDPRFTDTFGSWPHDTTSEWHLSTWTADWYALEPWERDGQGFYHHVQRRRYGGDLAGIIKKLDYLQELGIDALYLNPVFESPSLHKYDASSYHHIDDNFGPNPKLNKERIKSEDPMDPNTWVVTSADSLFFVLIRECHDRNMKIIIDGVWNHVGMTFWAFEDVVHNQQQSPYKDWFMITSWDDPETAAFEFDYKGWWDVRELPELVEDSTGFHKDAWQYMKYSIQKWMDPNGDGDPSDGIDGWRLDVAPEVGFPAWKKFRDYVRSINSQAYLSGEIWWDDDIQKWLQGDVFDAVMNYRFAHNCIRFFANEQNRISVSAFLDEFKDIRQTYPKGSQYALQNLLDSHDTDRIASMIINNDRPYGQHHRLTDNPDYDVRKPNAEEQRIHKLMVLFQMTWLGCPMVYYGNEAGMWGASDPDERKPMLWPEFEYADETAHPLDKNRPRDKNVFDHDLFGYYQTLINLRQTHPVLQTGDLEINLTDDDKELFAFHRINDQDTILVCINNDMVDHSFPLKGQGTIWADLVSGQEHRVVNETSDITIPAKSGMILELKRRDTPK